MMVHPGSVLGKRVPAAFGKVPALDCPTINRSTTNGRMKETHCILPTLSRHVVFSFCSPLPAAAERFEVQYLNLCTS